MYYNMRNQDNLRNLRQKMPRGPTYTAAELVCSPLASAYPVQHLGVRPADSTECELLSAPEWSYIGRLVHEAEE